MNNQISLETYRTKGAKIFTGRDRGEYVRDKSKIDKIENENEEVIIVIPDNLYSINPSFFEELFVNVVTKLGKENFYKKFNFKNDGTYNYEKPLKEAVARILREKTALD
jgi:restriction endonuclease Mrr